MPEVTLLAARVLSGLLAGLYLAFAVAVMPALRGMEDDIFTRVMIRINEVIVNPVFLAVFLGAPAAAALLLIWQRTPLVVAAALLGLVTLAITIAFNVPLNEALANGRSRGGFETPWLVWHAARTATAVAGFAVLCVWR